MIQVAKEFSNIKFLAYTKNNNIIFPSDIPPNLTFRFSMWVNYDKKTNLNLNAWIFDDIRKPKNGFICPGNCKTCTFCWDNKEKDVIFKKH